MRQTLSTPIILLLLLTLSMTPFATALKVHRLVDIPDPNLRAAIEAELGKNPDDSITEADMLTLQMLWIDSSGITDLTGLASAENLTVLDLWVNNISDISPLAGLTKLTYLDLSDNNISDILPLAGLVNLADLWLYENNISDISPLADLTNLTYLDLVNNNISDISPLADLTNLTELYLDYNRISDFSPIAGLIPNLGSYGNGNQDVGAPNTAVDIPDPNLRTAIEAELGKNPDTPITGADMLTLTTLDLGAPDNIVGNDLTGLEIEDLTGLESAENLTVLDLYDHNISDVSPLADLVNLKELRLPYNNISDVSPLAGLTKLRVLNLWDSSISDVSPLADLVNLEELSLTYNYGISDISPLTGLTKLTSLSLGGNNISDISPLADLTNLTSLSLGQNDISDISPLAGLVNLEHLWLSDNNISDISPLAGLTKLTQLLIEANRISDFSPIAGLIPNLVTYWNGSQKVDTPTDGEAIGGATNGGATKIYWAEGWGETPGAARIRRANPDGSNVEDILTNQMAVTRLSVDAASGKLYWMDGHGDGTAIFVRRSSLDGSNLETLAGPPTALVHGSLILDIIDRIVFWDYQRNNEVITARFNLIDDYWGEASPEDARDNVVNGKKYWHDSGQATIRRSNLDGSNVENLVSERFVTELTADGVSGKIYWYNYTQLRCANLDGSNLENLTSEGRVKKLTIDAGGGKMYWHNPNLFALRRANLDGSNLESIVSNVGFTSSLAFLPGVPTLTPPGDGGDEIETNATVSLSPASVASPAVGQHLTFSLNITGGENIAGYQAIVNFDPGTLRYVESANGDYLPAEAFFVPPKVSEQMPGKFTLAAASLAEVEIPDLTSNFTFTYTSPNLPSESQGNGTLATFTFEVLEAFASPVILSEVVLTDENGNTSYPLVVDAEITERLKFPEDVNQDGIVDIVDLTLVASNFNKQGKLAADVNGDNVVDIRDLTLVAGAFGTFAASPSVWLEASRLSLNRSDVALWLRQARAVNISTPSYARGLEVLEQLLAALTPTETALLVNYPNPFNPETWIPYHLAESAAVTLTIYAIDGQVVRRLDLGHQAAGYYQNKARAAYWDGRNNIGETVANGLYFYTLTAGEFAATRKMLIRK